jgi:hypothetical protein
MMQPTGMFLSLSKSSTATLLALSELALLLFGIMLVAGLVGEYFADHKKKEFPRCKKHKHLFEILVIVGVAGELFADGGVFGFGDHLQTIANTEVALLNKDAAAAQLEATKLKKQIEELRAGKIPIWRNISPEGSNVITAQLKNLKPLRIRIARAGNSAEVLHFGLQLVNIFKLFESDVVLVDANSPITGVKIYWKDWGGHGNDIDAIGKEVTAKVDISDAILRESGQVLDFNRTLFVEQTNQPFDLIVIIGENSR